MSLRYPHGLVPVSTGVLKAGQPSAAGHCVKSFKLKLNAKKNVALAAA